MSVILILVVTLVTVTVRGGADSLCDTKCNVNGTKSCEEGICTCKTNVIGADCSSCRHGAVDMDPLNEDGCVKCYCTDHSPSCQLQTWALSYVGEAFEATRGAGWYVMSSKNTSKTSHNIVRSFGGSSEYISYDDQIWELRSSNFYWVLPSQHLGDWLGSYGSNLFYTLNLRCGSDFACSFNQEPWVILRGGIMQDIQTIHHYKFESSGSKWRGLKEITVPLHEGYTLRTCWRTPDLNCISRTTMLNVLSNVVEVKIKAGIFRTSSSMAIGGYTREIASHAGDVLRRVEVCSCPSPYTGTSCQRCKPGLWHKHGWECERCECNNYSYTCNSFTGKCDNCAYDTACHNCDCCADGFYGKPTGAPNPCTPCPCDGRAETCSTNEDGSFGQCIDCEEGYTGRYCELCQDGYYGNPAAGVPCLKCHCSGNIDTSVTGNCHNVTGECYNCLYHTTGFRCDVCQRGYHGDATRQNCEQCKCDLIGAKDNICNATTGRCTCKENVVGDTCNDCAVETFGLSSGKGCTDCACDTSGTQFGSNVCDTRTGQCTCRADRQYRTCDGCVNGYFLKNGRCLGCQCPAARSLNYSCNGVTGQCYCQPQYTGQRCDVAACRREPWSDWTICDKPCGNGTQIRTRRIYVPDPDVMRDEGLPAEQCDATETETRSCNEASCTNNNTSECGVIEVMEPLYYENCRTRRHYTVKKCRGSCTHSDIDCCRPYLLKQKRYRLYCSNGRSVTRTFDEVQQCGCLAC
ncbi:hypothetical protein ACHWQZ_G002660 [Mnemiopsis leidyi]